MTEKEYACEDCKRDIDAFFGNLGAEILDGALNRALAHMTAGTTKDKHNIACQSC